MDGMKRKLLEERLLAGRAALHIVVWVWIRAVKGTAGGKGQYKLLQGY